MGLFDRFKPKNNALKAQSQQQINEVNQAMYKFMLGFDTPFVNPDNLFDYIDNAYNINSNVYSIVKKILSTISGVPYYVYETTDIKSLSKYKAAIQRKACGQEIEHYKNKALEQVEVSEISNLLKTPNNYQSFDAFFENYAGFLILTGNAYEYGMSPNAGINEGIITEMHNVPSQIVEIIMGTQQDPIKGYRLAYTGERSIIDKDKIMHSKTFNPNYGLNGEHLYGMSPIRAAYRVISSNNESFLAMVNSFKNMGVRGVLAGMTGAGEALTADQSKAIKDRLRELYGRGTASAGDFAVAGGNLSWVQMGQSLIDLSIIDSQKMSKIDLCNCFNVPSALMGEDKNSIFGSDYNAAKKSLITDAGLPVLERFKQDFNNWAVKKYNTIKGTNYVVDYDISVFSELQADFNEMVSALSGAWWLSPNQKLDKMFMPTINSPAMETVYIPSNYMPIDLMMETPSEPVKSIDEVDNYFKKLGKPDTL